MDFRKIIKFGNSSFVVSLPMDWVKKNKLRKGDTIYIAENGSNELIFSSKLIEDKSEVKEITLNANDKDTDQIERELVAVYINSYDIVNITPKGFKNEVTDIRKIVNNLIGFEITHQLSDKIIVRDFLNLNDVSVDDTLRKIDFAVRSMFDNLILFFNKKDCADLYDQDIDVNKLSFLVLRVIKRALEDPRLSKKFEMNNFELSITWNLVLKLEKIADSLKRIYKFGKKLNVDSGNKKKLDLLVLKLRDSYSDVMDAYHSKDSVKAYKSSSLKKGYMFECNKLFEKSNNVEVIRIIERLKDIRTHIGDVSRIVYMQNE